MKNEPDTFAALTKAGRIRNDGGKLRVQSQLTMVEHLRATERERCAKVADDMSKEFVAFAFDPDGHKLYGDARAREIAAAIRNLKE